jgi:hypothetical protein
MRKVVTGSVLLLIAFSAFGDKAVIKRGAAISRHATVVPLADVLHKPAAYTGKPVVVEGIITKSCSEMGCWMQVAPAADQAGVRVTFKDYAFFIPLKAAGMKVRAEGVTSVKTLSKEDADHLAGEGAQLVRNADGTADEISFVASGVELRGTAN